MKLVLLATALAATGTAFGQAAPVVPPVPKHAPIRIAGAVEAGMLIAKVQPKYPPEALAQHIGGTVVIHAIVSQEGLVESAEAVTGPSPLRSSAVDAVKQWRYRPYLLNGEPVPVDTTVVVNFNLDAPASPPAAVVVPPGSNNTEEQTRTGAVAAGPDAVPANPTKVKRVRISGGVISGNRITFVPPQFPPCFVPTAGAGVIVMHAIIDKTGHVSELSVLSGGGNARQIYTDAVKQWVYKPYLLNGEPVEVDTTITQDVALNGPSPECASKTPKR